MSFKKDAEVKVFVPVVEEDVHKKASVKELKRYTVDDLVQDSQPKDEEKEDVSQ